MRKVQKLAIFAHPEKSDAVKMFRSVCCWCRQMNIEVLSENEMEELDVVLTFGGDGFFVDIANLVADKGLKIPIAGVNFGTLGYLNRIEPDELGRRMEDLLNGNYGVSERNRLQIKSKNIFGPPVYAHALNDIYFERTTVKTVRYKVSIAGAPYIARRADGGLVATRTGSTAYNRTLGGPILIKEKNFVFKVMGPTEVDDRNAWIISENDSVVFSSFTGSAPRLVCDDKEIMILSAGDTIEIGKSKIPTRFIEFSDVDW